MAELKTKPHAVSVEGYLATVADPIRLADATCLVDLLRSVTGEQPMLWGTNIIGFGSYHYKYASGHEGDTIKVGLAVRKEHLVLYGVIFYDHNTGLLERLGKHKQGKGCLYIKKLADVDLKVLEEMIRSAWKLPSPAQG